RPRRRRRSGAEGHRGAGASRGLHQGAAQAGGLPCRQGEYHRRRRQPDRCGARRTSRHQQRTGQHRLLAGADPPHPGCYHSRRTPCRVEGQPRGRHPGQARRAPPGAERRGRMTTGLATITELLADLRLGKPTIIVDDEDRENEGDLILAAEHVSTEQLAFTIRHTGGVVCLAMPNDMADRLELPPMVSHNTARRSTAFTVSIEAREGVDTGISAKDRATTIRAATREGATAAHLSRPGHVFPLRARDGGVLRRAGHTEAAVDLSRLAGMKPAAALSELMHDDGTMMRLAAIVGFAAEHGLKGGPTADLIAHPREHR